MRGFLTILASLLTLPAFAAEPIVDSAGHTLVPLEGGSYVRGRANVRIEEITLLSSPVQYFGDNERPDHLVVLTERFYLAKHEVTRDQFAAFVEATGYVTTAEKTGRGILGWSPSELAPREDGVDYRTPLYDHEQKPEFTWRDPGFPQAGDHPVVGISWHDAVAYCDWLSQKEGVTYRLPTAAEWEYAAQAGNQGRAYQHFPWGDEFEGVIHEKANIANVELEKHRSGAALRHWVIDPATDPGDGHIFTAPVGSFPPNAYGVQDLLGNVWEWTADCFDDNTYAEWETIDRQNDYPYAVDPHREKHTLAVVPVREIRGGSWYGGPLHARPHVRVGYDEDEASTYVGFRVLREIPDSENGVLARLEDAIGSMNANPIEGSAFYAMNRLVNLTLGWHEAPLELVKKAAHLPRVWSFHLTGGDYSPAYVEAIADLPPHVSSLRLAARIPPEADLSPLVRLSPQLRRFELMHGSHAVHLDQLSGFTELENLGFTLGEESDVTDADIRKFAGNRNLKQIHISQSPRDIGAFLDAFEGAPLDYLTLSFTGEAAPDLAQLPRFPQIRFLRLYNGRFGAETLAPISSLQMLRDLAIDGSRVGEENTSTIRDEELAALIAGIPKIEILTLLDLQTGDQTAAEIPRLYYLDTLRMNQPFLTDAGLAEIAKSRSLKSLTLGNDMTGLTAAGISELWRIPNLERLTATAPTHSGDLSALQSAKSLTHLELPLPGLPDDFVETLERLPKLKKLVLHRAKDAPESTLPAAIAERFPLVNVELR